MGFGDIFKDSQCPPKPTHPASFGEGPPKSYDDYIREKKKYESESETCRVNLSTEIVKTTSLEKVTAESLGEELSSQNYEKGKLEKMKESPKAMLRGSVELHLSYLNKLKTHPDLLALANIKVPTHGDYHMEQIVFIDGKPKVSDFDESHTGGSALNDLLRGISSITTLGGDREKAKAFLDTYIKALRGENITLPDISKLGLELKIGETQESLLDNKFLGFDKSNNTFNVDNEKEKLIVGNELSNLKTGLTNIPFPGEIISAKSGKSNGVGSFGMEKITVAIKDGRQIKFFELKQQSIKHSADSFKINDKDIDHQNKERETTANSFGSYIKTVQIGGNLYTISEMVPNYTPFNLDKKTERLDYASLFMANELGKIHRGTTEGNHILNTLNTLNTKTQDTLIDAGVNFGNAIKDLQKTKQEKKD